MNVQIYIYRTAMSMVLIALFMLTGCARYATTVNALYEPVVAASGGKGDLYIAIPENKQTPASNVKWVIGKITDDENKKIGELYSPRSAAELTQSALAQELKRAGYTVFSVATRPASSNKLLDLTRVEISLDQLSDFADLKATCKLLMAMDVYKNGKLVRKLEYQSSSSKTEIKDRDLLARTVLQEALQSIMMKAVPDLLNQLEKQD